MTRTFIQTDEFSRNWDEFGFTDDDLRRLEFDIMMNPHKYPVMQGTGGLRKARFAFKPWEKWRCESVLCRFCHRRNHILDYGIFKKTEG